MPSSRVIRIDTLPRLKRGDSANGSPRFVDLTDWAKLLSKQRAKARWLGSCGPKSPALL